MTAKTPLELAAIYHEAKYEKQEDPFVALAAAVTKCAAKVDWETEVSRLKRELKLEQKTTDNALNNYEAALRTIIRLEESLDSIEVEGSVSTNGNVWRFWAREARKIAGKLTASEKKVTTTRSDTLLEVVQAIRAESCGEQHMPGMQKSLNVIEDLMHAVDS